MVRKPKDDNQKTAKELGQVKGLFVGWRAAFSFVCACVCVCWFSAREGAKQHRVIAREKTTLTEFSLFFVFFSHTLLSHIHRNTFFKANICIERTQPRDREKKQGEIFMSHDGFFGYNVPTHIQRRIER
jgi:hypothetical protein